VAFLANSSFAVAENDIALFLFILCAH